MHYIIKAVLQSALLQPGATDCRFWHNVNRLTDSSSQLKLHADFVGRSDNTVLLRLAGKLPTYIFFQELKE